jgi:hypothetical protein
MLKLEKLESSETRGINPDSFYRAKVPGGWLVFFLGYGDDEKTTSLCFYPDPTHSWDGSSV